MEAIIRTNDKNLFDSLLLFLKSLHITVEKKEAKSFSPLPQTISGKKMAEILEHISRSGGIESISDPVKWQKETRKDRKIL